MRAMFLLLVLVVAGCAHRSTPTADDKTMPADFAGTMEYQNGSVAPPYHYRWQMTFDDETAVVEWWPGYDEAAQSWQETAYPGGDQRSRLYGRLRDLGVFDDRKATGDGMVGGPVGRVEVTENGRTYDPGSLGGSKESAGLLREVAAAVEEFVPAAVWDALRARQDYWSANQPK